MNLILCGLPACGKTTFGKMLAKQIQWNFIDTDRLIENEHGKGCNCKQISIEKGEVGFRHLEKMVIASLHSLEKNVIAVGGGSLCIPENVDMLQAIGSLIYLKTPINRLWDRIQQRGLLSSLDPINPEKSFYEIAEKRIPQLERAAHYTVDATHMADKGILAELIKIKEIKYGK